VVASTRKKENMKKLEELRESLENALVEHRAINEELAKITNKQFRINMKITELRMEIKKLEKYQSPEVLKCLKLLLKYGKQVFIGKNYITKLSTLSYDIKTFETLNYILEKAVLPFIEGKNAYCLFGYPEGKSMQLRPFIIYNMDDKSVTQCMFDLSGIPEVEITRNISPFNELFDGGEVDKIIIKNTKIFEKCKPDIETFISIIENPS